MIEHFTKRQLDLVKNSFRTLLIEQCYILYTKESKQFWIALAKELMKANGTDKVVLDSTRRDCTFLYREPFLEFLGAFEKYFWHWYLIFVYIYVCLLIKTVISTNVLSLGEMESQNAWTSHYVYVLKPLENQMSDIFVYNSIPS